MQVLVVYESMYGNTRHVAEAIARGMGEFASVTVLPASEAIGKTVSAYDLVVVGGPTHVHGMSRPNTRHGAVEAAHRPGSDLELEPDAESEGIREWLATLESARGDAAAFDTRVDASPMFTGRASKTIGRKLRKSGFTLVADPESFLVDKQTVLEAGEAERASRWGRALVEARPGR